MNLIPRIKKVRKLLEQEDLKALVIDHTIDLFYLTGQQLSLGRLVIEPDETTLFVDGRYYEACKSRLPFSVILTNRFELDSAFGKWWKFHHEKVGFDAENTSYSEYERLLLLNSDWIPLKHPIKTIREIKDSEEIAALKQAAALGSKGYDFLLSQLREGVTEQALARELELFWIKEGGERLAFAPHIAFGEGSSQPHYHSGTRRLQKGDIVLIDIGVVCQHYHSDMTRVVFYGTPQTELKNIYEIVLQAYQSAVEQCRPGVLLATVDRAARSVIEDAGYKEYFTHGLGHGVGLEIHEFPNFHPSTAARPLQEGMVLTIEPGIYLPGIGGVRLEDTLLITPHGHENLTQRHIYNYKVD